MTIVETKVPDLVRGGVGSGNGFPALDSVDKGKKIIPQINGRVGDEERSDPVLDKLVPGKDNIDLGKGQDGGERIVGGVKDETFDGGALKCRGPGSRGATQVDIGEEEGSGVPKVKRGCGDSRAQIIKEKSRVGDKEMIDVKGDAFPRTLGVFHFAEPALGTVHPQFGKVPAEKVGIEPKSHRLDADR